MGWSTPRSEQFLESLGDHNYEAGWLKYPLSDEILLPDGGRRQEFEGGAIYVSAQNAIGSAIRNGAIRDKWNSVGGQAPGGSLLGYITGDEIGLPDGVGSMARFEFGVIYWSPATNAHIVRGAILHRWADVGYEQGVFGYPIAEQVDVSPTAWSQQFEHGTIGIDALPVREQVVSLNPFRKCLFRAMTDWVHLSTTKVNGQVVAATASGHGWWEVINNDCPAGTTATVKVQLQVRDLDGNWHNRGSEGQKSGVYPGGGSNNRAAANSSCLNGNLVTWRQEVDVDIETLVDPANREYGVAREIYCA